MLMALDRGILSRIDRRVFAELAHTAGVQAVKVPVSDAMWSTWRRYCEAIGLSMGEGVAGLIAHELETVVGDGDDAGDVFADRVARQAGERASRLDVRERELDTRAEQLRNKEAHLAAWKKLLRYFNNSCAYCSRPFDESRVPARDHFVPFPDGPGHASNTVPACKSCNRAKSSYDPDSWLSWLRDRGTHRKINPALYRWHS
jgi:5-methylcytosine-specific restriction endonuclease McrA